MSHHGIKNRYFSSPSTTDGKPHAAQASQSQEGSDNTASGSSSSESSERKMAIIYTCKKCSTRSMKTFNRSSYERGLVLVTCPGCLSKHLIADHLGWFGDKGFQVEQLGKERGGENNGEGGEGSGEGISKAERVKKISVNGMEGLTAEDVAGWSKVEALKQKIEDEAQEESKETVEITAGDAERWKRVNEKTA